MTAGESFKKGAASARRVTDRVVDAVEDRVDDVTEAVEGALHTAGEKIHHVAGRDDAKPTSPAQTPPTTSKPPTNHTPPTES